jgi:hypothetical protein
MITVSCYHDNMLSYFFFLKTSHTEILHNKTTSRLKGHCCSPDSKLESYVRSAVYKGRSLPITWNLERQFYWHPERSYPTDWRQMCEDWRIGNIGIWYANPLTLEESYWLLLRRSFTIGLMSADQHRQIGFRRGATSFKMRTSFIRQNGKTSQKLQGRPEKFQKTCSCSQ